ncbi:protein of unknown function [Streptomyces murinus]
MPQARGRENSRPRKLTVGKAHGRKGSPSGKPTIGNGNAHRVRPRRTRGTRGSRDARGTAAGGRPRTALRTDRSTAPVTGTPAAETGPRRRGRARPTTARAEKVQVSRELTWIRANLLPTRPMPGSESARRSSRPAG